MKPGIYYDIPFDEYLKLTDENGRPLVSASSIKGALEGSLLRMHGMVTRQVENKESPDRALGSQLHCWLLEGPEEFRKRYMVSSSCSAIVASGDNAGMPCKNSGVKQDATGNWFCGSHGKSLPELPNAEFLSESEFERIQRAAESLKNKPCFRVLRLGGVPEVTWVAEIYGVMCKGRLDFFREEGGMMIVDLKKHDRTPLSRQSALRAVESYQYRIQAQFYRLGIEALRNEKPVFWWIFAETKPMYDALHIQLEEKSDAYYAEQTIRIVLEKYRQCLESGKFPGAHDSAKPILSESAAWRNKQLILGENLEPDHIAGLDDVEAIDAVAYPY